PHERERDHRPEHSRDERGEDCELDADPDRAAQARIAERILPVLQREPLPRVVEASERVVERERDDDRDRQEEIRECEERVDVEDATPDPHRPAAAPMSRSVPTRREKTITSTMIAPMRMNESAAAVG